MTYCEDGVTLLTGHVLDVLAALPAESVMPFAYGGRCCRQMVQLAHGQAPLPLEGV